jgi:hypothetical protein
MYWHTRDAAARPLRAPDHPQPVPPGKVRGKTKNTAAFTRIPQFLGACAGGAI